MRALTSTLLILFLAACGSGGERELPTTTTTVEESGNGTVSARISGIRNDNGGLIVRLFRGKAGFPSDADKAFREATFEIRDGKATVTFENVPFGEYALWICHDENDNGKLDTNLLGMPKEGVGVSGPPPSFIPSYDEARFTLDAEVSEHAIALKYL